MPTIRRYERQVLPQPTGTPAAVPEGFGAGIGRAMVQAGQALGQTGDVVVRIQLEKELQKDRAQVRDVLNQARAQDREFMGGQYGKLGKDGTVVYDESVKHFEDSRRQWLQQLENPQQQELFSQAYDPLVNSHLDAALRHQNNQIEVYDKSTRQAMISQTTADAIVMRNDPDFVRASLMEVEAETRDIYKHLGPDVVADELDKARGRFYTELIGARLEDDPIKAKEYYEKVKAEIPGGYQVALEKRLETAGVQQKSQQAADDIMATGGDPAQRLAMARKIKDENVRDTTVQRIKARNAEEKQFEEEARQALIAEKTNGVLNAGSLEAALDVANTVENGKDRLELTRVAHSLYGGEKTASDPAKVLEARIRIDRGEIPNIETLFKEYKPYASESDWKQLENYFRSGGAAGGLKDSTVRTMFKNMTGKSAEEKPEQYQGVWNYVLRNLPEGKKPIDADVRQLVGQALAEGERKGGGWGYGEDMPYLEAVEKGVADTWLPDVTGDEEEKITRILNENGKLVTDQTIRLYKKHVILGIPLPAGPLEVK